MSVLISIQKFTYLKSFLLGIFLSQITACGSDEAKVHTTLKQEKLLQNEWQAQKIRLSGTVLDATAAPVNGARISFNGIETMSDAAGNFELINLPPANGVLEVSGAAYYTETRVVHLQQFVANETLKLSPLVLDAKQAAQVRFIFGGDVSFGRRFLDPDEITPRDQMPRDNPDALIKASNPEAGTKEVMKWLRPWYRDADWAVVNLETPVTNNPSTPHLEKPFAFFTLPGSLKALVDLGVDYVSLGNNHVYDYLDTGLTDTLLNVDAVGIKHSGAGATPEAAFKAYRTEIKGHKYAFVSATSVIGNQYGIGFVADSLKGGAADLSDNEQVIAALQAEKTAGYFPIVQWHTGKEYTFTATNYVESRFSLAVDNGAALIIAHHPHVAQGVSLEKGVFILQSLGNLAFDQSRLETFMGLVARVDMTANRLDQLKLLPVYLKKYAPLPVTGDLANRFLRRVAEYSKGVTVYPYQYQGFVALNKDQVIKTEELKTVDVTIGDDGQAIIDLRAYVSSDASLSLIDTEANVDISMGHDLMLFGDFEDWDADENNLEAAHWDVTGASRFVCLSHAYRGLAGLCSVLDGHDTADSVTIFRNRIRVLGDALNVPNKALSLFGYIKAENGGEVNITAKYYASAGELTFGEELAYTEPAGDYDWKVFRADLNMPVDDTSENPARATRIFIRQSPPPQGESTVAFDELAVINWDENKINVGETIRTPHAADFIRLQGAPGMSLRVTLSFARYAPTN